ncbi:MAG: hypothetical protein PHD40_05645 [Syntrophomonadaceae bacterium]|nr:hypothetical protein [Syntrophomonadaceae bacterium]
MINRKYMFAGILLSMLVLEASLIGVLKTDNAAFYLAMLVASSAIVMGCYHLYHDNIQSVVPEKHTHLYIINQSPLFNDPLFDRVHERM